MHKKILSSLLFAVFCLTTSLLGHDPENPPEDDDECDSAEECCDDAGEGGDDEECCEDDEGGGCGETCVSSFRLNIFLGTAPHEPALHGGALRIHKRAPSPAVFTPQGLVFRDLLETFLGRTDGESVTVIRYRGTTVTYEFASNSSVGLPVGSGRTFRSRLWRLDQNGDPVGDMASAKYFERRFPTGAVVRYSAETKNVVFLRTAGGREITRETRGVDVVREKLNGLDVIRQVRGSRAFADVRTDANDPYGYEIHLFAPDQVGAKTAQGLYTLSGAAHTVWRIENPAQDDQALDEILVTKTSGSRSWEYRYHYSQSVDEWSLTRGDVVAGPARVERKHANTPPGWPTIFDDERDIVRELFDGDPAHANLLSKTTRTQRAFPWGPETVLKVLDPDGLALATSYEFYNDGFQNDPGRFGRLKRVDYPDGRWVEYDYDNFGRKILETRPFGDGDTRTIEYSYEAVDPSDHDFGQNPTSPASLSQFAWNPRRTLERIGANEVSRTYRAYTTENNERVEIVARAVTPGAAYTDPTNLRTVRTFHAPGSAIQSGRLRSVRHPDGRTDRYSYELIADVLITTRDTLFGAPDGAHVEVAGHSVSTRTHVDQRGLEILREVFVYDGSGFSSTPISRVSTIYNQYGEVEKRLRQDGAGTLVLHEAHWADGQKEWEQDAHGVRTSFIYDALEQVAIETLEGISGDANAPSIAAHLGYDEVTAGCGCCTAKNRTIIVDGVHFKTETKKDKAGRLLNTRDADGLITHYTYADGGRIVNRILPNSSIEQTVRYEDGQVHRVTFDEVPLRTYVYGSTAPGSRFQKIYFGEENAPRWEKTVYDMAGRVVEQIKPAHDAGLHTVTYEYGAAGRLASVTRPGQAPTVYEYDVAGNLFRTGYVVNGGGPLLEEESDDFIAETSTRYSLEAFPAGAPAAWFRLSTSAVFGEDGRVVLNETRERLSGFASGVLRQFYETDAHQNTTVTTITVDPATRTTLEQTVVPGSGIIATRKFINGLLREENSSQVEEPTLFTYDGFGRLASEIDPRLGETFFVYRDFDRNAVDYTGRLVAERIAPGNLVTSFGYFEEGDAGAGQIAVREDADGKKTYFLYNGRNQVTHTWGAGYPVHYEYDPVHATLIRQHTYRGGSDWFGSLWPSNPGVSDVTTWHYEPATGLLLEKEYPDGKGTTYTYHASNQLHTRTWARKVAGQDLVTTYTYWENKGGNLKRVEYSDTTPSVDYAYTRSGQIREVVDAVGTRTFAYNAALDLETETIEAGAHGLYSLVLTRKYEGSGAGQIPGRPAGGAVGSAASPAVWYDTTWSYDSQGRFGRVQGPGLPAHGAVYSYLPESPRVESVDFLSDPSTAVARTQYLPVANRNLVAAVVNSAGDHLADPSSAVIISEYAYGYSAHGNRTSVNYSGTAFGQIQHVAFGYNDRREVVLARQFDGASDQDPEVLPRKREYAFDPIGNRLMHADGGGNPFSYETNELNQYEEVGIYEFLYDFDGNLTRIADDSEPFAFFRWDGENRLRDRSLGLEGNEWVEFTYDYRGRRVATARIKEDGGRQVIWKRAYVWDDWNLLLVLDENNQPLESFTWGLDIAEQARGLRRGGRPGAAAGGVGGLLAASVSDGSATLDHLFFYDGNGNVGQLLDWASGQTVAHYEYDPFGNIVVSNGARAVLNRFRFSTKYQDPDTGLYYYGYRFYSRDLGRWINRDPIGEAGGRNLYGFIGNCAASRLDFLGLIAIVADWNRGNRGDLPGPGPQIPFPGGFPRPPPQIPFPEPPKPPSFGGPPSPHWPPAPQNPISPIDLPISVKVSCGCRFKTGVDGKGPEIVIFDSVNMEVGRIDLEPGGVDLHLGPCTVEVRVKDVKLR